MRSKKRRRGGFQEPATQLHRQPLSKKERKIFRIKKGTCPKASK